MVHVSIGTLQPPLEPQTPHIKQYVAEQTLRATLGIKDLAEAKGLHAIALPEPERRWAALRAGPRRRPRLG